MIIFKRHCNWFITGNSWFIFMITGSIVFLLKGSRESGYSFEALGTCISSTATKGYINVQIVKLLNNSATLANRLQPLMEGHTVAWPQNLVALYKTSEETGQNANNSKVPLLLHIQLVIC